MQKKSNQRWVWIVLCRPTRQVVAYFIGDRSAQACQQLWRRVPPNYRGGHCYTDFWDAYQKVLPSRQHRGSLAISEKSYAKSYKIVGLA